MGRGEGSLRDQSPDRRLSLKAQTEAYQLQSMGGVTTESPAHFFTKNLDPRNGSPDVGVGSNESATRGGETAVQSRGQGRGPVRDWGVGRVVWEGEGWKGGRASHHLPKRGAASSS